MNAIANGFWILGAVTRQTLVNCGLFLWRHQTLGSEVADRLIATTTAKDEIDRRQHAALGHLSHHKADRWRLRLRWFGRTPLALMPLGCSPNLAVGVKASARLVQQRVQPFGTAETELQRNRPVIANHQRGRTMDLLNPIGELTSIGDGGR